MRGMVNEGDGEKGECRDDALVYIWSGFYIHLKCLTTLVKNQGMLMFPLVDSYQCVIN